MIKLGDVVSRILHVSWAYRHAALCGALDRIPHNDVGNDKVWETSISNNRCDFSPFSCGSTPFAYSHKV